MALPKPPPSTVGNMTSTERSGDSKSLAQPDGAEIALQGAMSHGARVSRDAMVALYELCSWSSLYQSNPLERLFRDGMVALQHANHSAAFFEAAVRVRFGLDHGVGLF